MGGGEEEEANEPCDTRHQRGGVVVVAGDGGVEQQHTMMCGFGAMMKEADTRNVVDVSSWKDQREGKERGRGSSTKYALCLCNTMQN